MKIKEWYHMSLTSNISAKTWSNLTCRGCDVLKTSGPADSKSVPGFGVIEQNKISNFYENYCIRLQLEDQADFLSFIGNVTF